MNLPLISCAEQNPPEAVSEPIECALAGLHPICSKFLLQLEYAIPLKPQIRRLTKYLSYATFATSCMMHHQSKIISKEECLDQNIW